MEDGDDDEYGFESDDDAEEDSLENVLGSVGKVVPPSTKPHSAGADDEISEDLEESDDEDDWMRSRQAVKSGTPTAKASGTSWASPSGTPSAPSAPSKLPPVASAAAAPPPAAPALSAPSTLPSMPGMAAAPAFKAGVPANPREVPDSADICVCGRPFKADAKFCGKCGKSREFATAIGNLDHASMVARSVAAAKQSAPPPPPPPPAAAPPSKKPKAAPDEAPAPVDASEALGSLPSLDSMMAAAAAKADEESESEASTARLSPPPPEDEPAEEALEEAPGKPSAEATASAAEPVSKEAALDDPDGAPSPVDEFVAPADDTEGSTVEAAAEATAGTSAAAASASAAGGSAADASASAAGGSAAEGSAAEGSAAEGSARAGGDDIADGAHASDAVADSVTHASDSADDAAPAGASADVEAVADDADDAGAAGSASAADGATGGMTEMGPPPEAAAGDGKPADGPRRSSLEMLEEKRKNCLESSRIRWWTFQMRTERWCAMTEEARRLRHIEDCLCNIADASQGAPKRGVGYKLKRLAVLSCCCRRSVEDEQRVAAVTQEMRFTPDQVMEALRLARPQPTAFKSASMREMTWRRAFCIMSAWLIPMFLAVLLLYFLFSLAVFATRPISVDSSTHAITDPDGKPVGTAATVGLHSLWDFPRLPRSELRTVEDVLFFHNRAAHILRAASISKTSDGEVQIGSIDGSILRIQEDGQAFWHRKGYPEAQLDAEEAFRAKHGTPELGWFTSGALSLQVVKPAAR